MATVELKSVKELFGKTFFIPSYQRGYRWTDTQIEELLEDLYEFSISRKKGIDYYCLQPVIVKKQNDVWELVDGQQRLTALWLVSALYYCSNKDAVMNLERMQYKMEYEAKDVFTELFDEINDFVEDGTIRQIEKMFAEAKGRSIDSRYLIQSMECIARFHSGDRLAQGVLADIFAALDDIKIIWYVLDAGEDSIQTFTNINANKIELTNAELIKAVLLCANKDDENSMQNMALQWEEIEKGLNNNNFWNFIVNEKRKAYSTRIDYLFELWCSRNDYEIQSTGGDRYSVFRIINERLSESSTKGDEAKRVWNSIQGIYETLMDWYHEYFYYHTIGLLLIINEKQKDVDIINDLYKIYSTSDKKTFIKEIKNKIKEQYFGKNKAMPFEVFELDKIKNSLGDVTFQEHSQVKSVLLLYNIAMLINANNTYERFPFELYKDETWDIEHINPQTSPEVSPEEKVAWLKSYQELLKKTDIISDSSVLAEIQHCLDNRLAGFEEIVKLVNDLLGIRDNHSITNLVLLDANTNRGYKNACFAEKRKKIIEVERTRVNDEKYIPIGTKWVFLKGFENAEQLIVWGPVDMQDYSNDIANSIFVMLGETQS